MKDFKKKNLATFCLYGDCYRGCLTGADGTATKDIFEKNDEMHEVELDLTRKNATRHGANSYVGF